jgi:hypothetical protein
MNPEQLKQLVLSMQHILWGDHVDARRVMNILSEETIRFRDKLKEETGVILTVADARSSLEALGCHFNGGAMPEALTPEQRALTQIWIDRLTVFEKK